MNVKSITLYEVLSDDKHYVLPHFQRQYTWESKNWKDLLTDVSRIYDSYDEDRIPEHFMGTLVVIDDDGKHDNALSYKLVDGQQRLTTISLLLRVLYELSSDMTLRQSINGLLFNENQDGDLHYKMLLTQKNEDRQTFKRVIHGEVKEDEQDKTISVVDNAYRFLLRQVRYWVETEGRDLSKLFKVITECLQFVFIWIDKKVRPYAIFESLNAKGKPLTQTDLVRNYIAMKLPSGKQERLFEQYWARIDALLSEDRKVARIGELSAFLRHYLAFRTGFVEREDMIYIRFRDRMEADFNTPELFEQELRELLKYAGWYNRLIRPDNEADGRLRAALTRLNVLESTTAYPLLLAAYRAHEEGELPTQPFVNGLVVLESYLVRRILVGETTFTSRMFPSIIKLVDYSDYAGSLRGLLSQRRSVSDIRLRQELPNRPLYDKTKQERLCFILEGIEKYLWRGTDGYVSLDNKPTLEHILPQTPSQEWKDALGDGLQTALNEYVHTLGNLTLVTQKVNSANSNHSFERKLEVLRDHALKMNSQYFQNFNGIWDANAIHKRAHALIDTMIKVWPSLGDTEETHKSEETKDNIYIPARAVKGMKATGLILLGKEYKLKSWKDIAVKMCELAIQDGIDFSELTEQMSPSYFPAEKNNSTILLSNGRYMSTDLTADYALGVCRTIGDVMDWEEGRDWQPLYINRDNSVE